MVMMIMMMLVYCRFVKLKLKIYCFDVYDDVDEHVEDQAKVKIDDKLRIEFEFCTCSLLHVKVRRVKD